MNEKILAEEFEKIRSKNWISLEDHGYGSVGLLFERLLGISSNKLQYPDYFGIEIKTKYSKKEEYITLFCLNPKSDKEYAIKYLVTTYGYKGRNTEFNVLNVNVNSRLYKKIDKHYFKLAIDDKNNLLRLNIYDINKEIVDESIFWDMNELLEKFKEKCGLLGYIMADRKIENKVRYVKYNSLQIYKYIDDTKIIEAIKKGTIRICFRIGVIKDGDYKGEPYNHGTAFEIKVKDLEKIFEKIY